LAKVEIDQILLGFPVRVLSTNPPLSTTKLSYPPPSHPLSLLCPSTLRPPNEHLSITGIPVIHSYSPLGPVDLEIVQLDWDLAKDEVAGEPEKVP
jgi:hypothetical protein